MKMKCPFCNTETVNEFHRAAVHTKTYHDLLFKIHEKIEELGKVEKEQGWIVADRHEVFDKIKILKSLLENKK